MNESAAGSHSIAIDSATLAHVILFPSFAYRIDDRKQWRAEIHGVTFKPKEQKLKRKLLLNVLRRLIDLPPEELSGQLFQSRVTPFFCAPYKSKRIQLQIGQRTVLLRRKTRRDGQFRARLKMSDREIQSLCQPEGQTSFDISAGTANGKSHRVNCRMRAIHPAGVSVITDIDDTIKESNVENRSELLANTFLREFRVVNEIGETYAELGSRGVEFHYVSASPWQLFEPLNQMLVDHRFPSGSVHLRSYALSDHLLKRLGVIHRGGKAAAIRRILARFPCRKFILVGDSGERDIPIYARCFRDNPGQIGHILIRLVRPEHRYNESVIEAKMNLPATTFNVFESGQELRELLENSPILARA